MSVPVHIESLAKHASLPVVVQDYIADHYPEARELLLRNPNAATEVVERLFQMGLPAATTAQFVAKTERPELIEAMILSGEHRQSVISSLMKYWDLSVTYQWALASNSNLTMASAEELSDRYWATPGLPAKLLAKTSLDRQRDWLFSHADEMGDEEVWEDLLRLNMPGRSGRLASTQALLHNRPALARWAAGSEILFLAAAAAACPLEQPEQAAVIETCARHASTSAKTEEARLVMALAGNMLDRPGTTKDSRAALKVLLPQSHKDELLRARVPVEVPPFSAGTQLVDMRDETELAAILLRNSECRLANRRLQWRELVENPHLSDDMAVMLYDALTHLGAEPGHWGEKLLATHPDLAHRVKFRASVVYVPSPKAVNEDKTARRQDRRTRSGAIAISYTWDPEVTSTKKSAWGRSSDEPFEGSAVAAGQVLSKVLGDDTVAWEIAFGLMPSFTGKTSELAKASKLLASS